MKYYKIQIDISKLRTYPISKRMVDGYLYNQDNSVYKLKARGKLEFIPNFNSIELIKSANPKNLDLISSVVIADSGIIISDKLLEIIRKFKFPNELQVFDVNAIHKNVDYHYNYFYIYDSREKDIFDFENAFFYKTKFGTRVSDKFKLTYPELKKRSLFDYEEITPEKILLNDRNIDTDIFSLDLTQSGYYISENLKSEIERNNIKGIKFTQI